MPHNLLQCGHDETAMQLCWILHMMTVLRLWLPHEKDYLPKKAKVMQKSKKLMADKTAAAVNELISLFSLLVSKRK